MDNNLNKNIRVIMIAAGITFLAILPWLLSHWLDSEMQNLSNTVAPEQQATELKEAMYYEKMGGDMVQCRLCPNRCLLSDGQTGTCKARKNIGGQLYSMNYNQPVTEHVDPIEKKPLYHFLPGARAYSLAAAGCNMSCQFCQNWNISQKIAENLDVPEKTPEEVVNDALASDSQVIAFTYSEPIIFYEYMLDTAKLAKQKGLKTVMISGGYINPEPLENLLPWLDGVKIDLKAFDNEFYRELTNGRLQPVLDTIKTIDQEGTHLEIVYLLIPGENDSDQEIKKMAKWLRDNVGQDAILHLSRFHPTYKMTNKPPTPTETVIRARELALEAGLQYVYTGNIPYPKGESTYCPDGSVAIKRNGYFVKSNNLENGRCPGGTQVPGVWRKD